MKNWKEGAVLDSVRVLLLYRGVNKGLYVLLSRTQAGPGRTVKQEQEEISRNHIQTFIYLSVHKLKALCMTAARIPKYQFLILLHKSVDDSFQNGTFLATSETFLQLCS